MDARRGSYKTFSESLRVAIAESELSFKALERETGVKRQSIMKFMAGKQSLRLDMADKLAAHLGLKVVKRKA
jgi:plasmid maintenance system antidote protein VapI